MASRMQYVDSPRSGGAPIEVERFRRRRSGGRLNTLPEYMKPTDQMTPWELELEARRMRPLLKKWGFRDSAMFHSNIIRVQYLRAAQFIGWMGIRPYFVFALSMLVFTLGVIGVFYILVEYGYNASLSTMNCVEGVECDTERGRLRWYWSLLGGFILGLVVAGPGSVMRMSGSRFDAAYAPSRVVEAHYRDPERKQGRQVSCLTNVPLLRLASATRQEGRYIGEESKSSFAKGRSLLETQEHIPAVDDVRVFYDAEPRQSTWTGVYADATHSWYNLAGNAGKLDRALKQKRKEKGWKLDPMGNAGAILLLAAFVFALIMALTGFDAQSYVSENLPYG